MVAVGVHDAVVVADGVGVALLVAVAVRVGVQVPDSVPVALALGVTVKVGRVVPVAVGVAVRVLDGTVGLSVMVGAGRPTTSASFGRTLCRPLGGRSGWSELRKVQ